MESIDLNKRLKIKLDKIQQPESGFLNLFDRIIVIMIPILMLMVLVLIIEAFFGQYFSLVKIFTNFLISEFINFILGIIYLSSKKLFESMTISNGYETKQETSTEKWIETVKNNKIIFIGGILGIFTLSVFGNKDKK